ncbi:uncharacterized protein LOC101862014 [Aplysia californica]|uniref:Uncharacterized protein LOC101862014 n=1 Tax=Aplysia californica TaxID=6500 RepID=A0ABM0JFZ1_APLCA|nr:uncharacterized protein LOC101862014 [Aplysia californica]
MTLSQAVVVAVFVAGFALTANGCTDHVRACVAPVRAQVEPFMHSPESVNAFLQIITVDLVCNELLTFYQCVDLALKTECANHTLDDADYEAFELIPYFCGPAGRPVLEAMSQAPCSKNLTSIRAMSLLVERTCQVEPAETARMYYWHNDVTGTERDLAVLCPLENQARTCAVSGSTALCGEPFGQFVNKIWPLARRGVFQLVNCSQSTRQATSFTKRTLGQLFGF